MNTTACGICLALATITAAGCTAPVYENRYPYEDGWQLGTVTDVGLGLATVAHATLDCRERAAPTTIPGRSFARVTYYHARNLRSIIAPLRDGERPAVGASVYVNIVNCDATIAVPGTAEP